MSLSETKPYAAYAEAFAFLGNSLMQPPSQTGSFAVDPAFWGEFPTFEDSGVEKALVELSSYAQALAAESEFDPVTDVSVEFTELFVGPPEPKAAPWETMYRGEGTNIGFGAATHEMRTLMRESGLKMSNENNQYEDHMGIELLYLSVLCQKAAEEKVEPEQIDDFVASHPGDWIGKLSAKVEEGVPDGYYVRFLALCDALLKAVCA